VLVVNAYSTLNRGDAVILDGLLASLRASGARHIAVSIPSGPGEAERRLALGADEVVPMPLDVLSGPSIVRRLFAVHALWICWQLALITLRALLWPRSLPALRAYKDADLIVSTGGAYLGGPRPGINLLTAYQIVLARLLGRPCVVAPVTIKPMTRAVTFIVEAALRGIAVFGRDEATVVGLRSLGLHATLAADLAFRSPAGARARLRTVSHRGGLVVALAPRKFGWDAEAYRARNDIAAATAGAVATLVRRRGARVLVITQSNADDLENDTDAIERLMPMLPADIRSAVEVMCPAETIDAAVEQYARAHVVYAYRLHAAILALLAGTPSAVIDYEPKVRGVLGMLGLRHWVLTPGDASDGRLVVSRLEELTAPEELERIDEALEIAARMTIPFEEELRRRLRRGGGPTPSRSTRK
jgi:polysaccharide pyruvyl transferase WcaK-like protein